MRLEGVGWGRDCRGHTLVEVAVSLVLATIVLASVLGVLVGQRRLYTRQVRAMDSRDAARIASEVLASELRAASPSAGDLYAIAADSVALRSTTGIGVTCSVAGNAIGLRRLAGALGASLRDSALIYLQRRADTSTDDGWTGVSIEGTRPGGPRLCPDGRPPDLEVSLSGSVEGAAPGSPVRAFRPYVYRLYRGPGGDWWLGQRPGRGRIQPLAGPFASPANGGLKLEYFDESGAATRDPSAVAWVRISVTETGAWPGQPARRSKPISTPMVTAVYLRNR